MEKTLSESPGQPSSAKARRTLRATLPIGIVLLIVWLVWVAFEIAVGDAQRVSWWISAAFGLGTCLILIASGVSY